MGTVSMAVTRSVSPAPVSHAASAALHAGGYSDTITSSSGKGAGRKVPPHGGVLAITAWALRTILLDRSSRVRIMLAAVIAMSLVDLDLTLVYARNTGMEEHNPIAREIMNTGSAGLLVLWKLLTMSVAVGLLYRVRAHRTGELGSLLCLVVLCWLTARWLSYNSEIESLQCAATSAAVRADPKFVMITDGN